MSNAPGWRVLPFAVEAFGTELRALCRDVPLLDQVLCEIEARHDPQLAEDRALRNHHRDLALHGHFLLNLPESGAILRSGHSVILEDKADFFGVVGRRDLMLAGNRVGFSHPLCAVVLPLHKVAITVRGPRWNIEAQSAARAVALFTAAGIDWSAEPRPDVVPALVVGDENYAHHAWNQLGALSEILARAPNAIVFATHQPLGNIADLFDDTPGLTVTHVPARDLPGIDPRRFIPFAPGGRVVLRTVRERVRRLAAQRVSAAVRDFCARAAAEERHLIWMTVRGREKSAVNLLEALAALAEALLRRGNFGIVLDGFGVPEDFDANGDYHNSLSRSMIAREQIFTQVLCGMLRERLGDAAMAQVFQAVGGRLLDSIYIVGQCRAYFAHNGTLQHRAGYFTSVPGLVHASPGDPTHDRAANQRDVAPDGGDVVYVERTLIDEVVPRGGIPGASENPYRFNDIPKLVAAFEAQLAAWGLA